MKQFLVALAILPIIVSGAAAQKLQLLNDRQMDRVTAGSPGVAQLPVPDDDGLSKPPVLLPLFQGPTGATGIPLALLILVPTEVPALAIIIHTDPLPAGPN